MPSPFARSIRSLGADRFHSSGTSIAIAMIILTAWMCWFLFATIARHEVSDSARLEVDRAAHALYTPGSELSAARCKSELRGRRLSRRSLRWPGPVLRPKRSAQRAPQRCAPSQAIGSQHSDT
jgi:hypothetical protein